MLDSSPLQSIRASFPVLISLTKLGLLICRSSCAFSLILQRSWRSLACHWRQGPKMGIIRFLKISRTRSSISVFLPTTGSSCPLLLRQVRWSGQDTSATMNRLQAQSTRLESTSELDQRTEQHACPLLYSLESCQASWNRTFRRPSFSVLGLVAQFIVWPQKARLFLYYFWHKKMQKVEEWIMSWYEPINSVHQGYFFMPRFFKYKL